MAASPLVTRGKVIVPVGGVDASLVAVDANTGSVVWKCGEFPASYATPLPVRLGDRRLVVAPLENSLLCADADTGEHLWEVNLSSGYDEHSAALLYREPLLVSSAPFRSGATCYRLAADDGSPASSAEPVWESGEFSNDIASSVLVDDFIYGFDLREAQSRINRPSRGMFRCLGLVDGTVRWSSKEPGHANVIVAGDKLLLFNDRGELRLCRASPDRYDELARTAVFTDEICWTPPALSNGRVYLRTQSRAVCLFIGRETSSSEGTSQTVADIPRASRVDVSSWLGGEREFPATAPERSDLWRWYAWTAGVIVAAGVCLLLISAVGSFLRSPEDDPMAAPGASSRSIVWISAAYWIAIIGGGLVGSGLLNPGRDELLFTWPLALWGLMQIAVEASVRATQKKIGTAAWSARGAILFFVVGCCVYFHLCRQLGLAPEWSFLTGFVPAAPLAMLIARWFRRNGFRRLAVLPAHVVSYTIYFWGSVLFMTWRMRIGS